MNNATKKNGESCEDFEVNDEGFAALSEEKQDSIKRLAAKYSIPLSIMIEKLKIRDGCYLVPLANIEEHKKCLFDLFSFARPEYMKYYLNGKLRTTEVVTECYFTRGLAKNWNYPLPKTLTFIIDCDNVSIGRIAVGPIDDPKITGETGYCIKEAYSRKGLTSAALRSLLGTVQYLNDVGKYKIKNIFATCRVENLPSSKILLKNGFVKTEETRVTGDAVRNVYLYTLK